MDQPGPSGSGEPNAKRRNENDEIASDDDAVAANECSLNKLCPEKMHFIGITWE